ncbi:MAG: chemotaxis protein [Bradyrhizobiaceae bacterium]|nr:MAG: chemotaxis protein [Bradyrhizobiaceae bacterium]
MAIQRKRFRVEDMQFDDMEANERSGMDLPIHEMIMSELRAIRDQMGRPLQSAEVSKTEQDDKHDAIEVQAALDVYRAQIAQCEKLKVELDLIHDAINRTKLEIAVLHVSSFDGEEMTKVTGELGAIVGGTERATEQILEAAESIDQAASLLAAGTSPGQQARLAADISDRVVGIFEACNFQDLTGQRISKVMNTVKFIEHHINVMMDIWGGVDAIKAHTPAVTDSREGDARLLNGPKSAGEEGHASQNDIDAIFG